MSHRVRRSIGPSLVQVKAISDITVAGILCLLFPQNCTVKTAMVITVPAILV